MQATTGTMTVNTTADQLDAHRVAARRAAAEKPTALVARRATLLCGLLLWGVLPGCSNSMTPPKASNTDAGAPVAEAARVDKATPPAKEATGTDDAARPVSGIAAAGGLQVAADYATHCASCHGDQGDGNGPAAYLLFHKPRDFTTGAYRFKSTPDAKPPTTADVVRTIRQGVERTAMPPFEGVLNPGQIEALTTYVLALNQRAGAAAAGDDPAADAEATPIVIPPQPKTSDRLVAEGAKVYTAMSCWQCHGETGKGDGPSSYTLVDSEGYPLPPADFTTGVYKAGRTDDALYRAIMLGIPGTPMPSFSSAMKLDIDLEGVSQDTDLVWAMVAYLRSLEVPREPEGVRSGATLLAGPAAEADMLVNPNHPAWDAVEATAISLQPLWQRKHSARSVMLRAVHHGGQIAVLMQWPDSTADAIADSTHHFTDAGSLMFSMRPQPPALSMGAKPDGGAEAPSVNIWHWRADRQVNARSGELRDVPLGAAGAPADYYVGKRGRPTAGPITEHDPLYLPAWREGNPKADPELLLRAVLESNAAGFGTLTLQPAKSQHVFGEGAWVHGSWRVVLRRTLEPAEDGDIDLTKGALIPFAAAVWDGSAGDRNGTKLISGWHWLKIATADTAAGTTGLQDAKP